VLDQVDALLHVESADEGDHRLRRIPHLEPPAQGLGVAAAPLDRLHAVGHRNEGIAFGVPHLVVETVQNPAELSLVEVQDVAEAAPLGARAHLPGVVRRDRGDEVGIDDGPLGEVECQGIRIVGQAIRGEEVLRPPEACHPQDVATDHALVGEVVDGVTNPLSIHAEPLVDLVQQDRHQGRLPIVRVDDVGPLASLVEELDGGFAEEGEALGLVGKAVEGAAIEEAIVVVRLDEEALAAMDEAEPHGAVHLAIGPGDTQRSW